jgi:Ca2+-binding RTX toxin-like protein
MAIKYGTNGDNVLSGTSSADQLFALGGDDLVYGFGGNDILHGGAGDDQLFGGAGNDTAFFATSLDVSLELAFNSWSPGTGFDVFDSIENVTTGSGTDDVIGDDFANILSTGGGGDEVLGEGGNDTIFGGGGGDDLEGGAGDDIIFGESGNDSMVGEEGDDVLEGGAGNDQLDGYTGVDLFTGGAGADSFFFRPGDSGVKFGTRDIIIDFDPNGGDEIQLHFFDGLEFIDTDAFSAEDQVRYVQKSGNTYVQISTDADAASEMTIELTGTITLQADDFYL